ncbi:transketolase [Bacillus haynesii]|nr:transketolase [Bacillus haynesii]MCY8018731.1 transketolase [Bacillus haynesii]MCY8432731.1 transketolase [Bacillus haynesii]MCY8735324.1 transketolase [Bacillus haynesii]MCY9385726.1 transketolase [Bacillus haynesii]
MMSVREIDMERFRDQIRLLTLKQLHHLGFGHYGGSLSIADVLAVLYGKVMKIDPANPSWEDRDFFILSKGHGGPALYAALHLTGYFEEDVLYTLNQNGTALPSHPDRNLTPGVDMTTGSLGQGISAAAGVALSHKLSGRTNRTFVIVGDGELNEGQCWEAIQFAAHHKLHNLYVFVDDNKQQLDGPTKDIIDPLDFVSKFSAFGFYSERVNGHEPDAIYQAVKRGEAQRERPVAVILDTVKGKGIPYFENMENSHHIRANDEQNRMIEKIILTLEEKEVRA